MTKEEILRKIAHNLETRYGVKTNVCKNTITVELEQYNRRNGLLVEVGVDYEVRTNVYKQLDFVFELHDVIDLLVNYNDIVLRLRRAIVDELF